MRGLKSWLLSRGHMLKLSRNLAPGGKFKRLWMFLSDRKLTVSVHVAAVATTSAVCPDSVYLIIIPLELEAMFALR